MDNHVASIQSDLEDHTFIIDDNISEVNEQFGDGEHNNAPPVVIVTVAVLIKGNLLKKTEGLKGWSQD
jgi:hypothetical protein